MNMKRINHFMVMLTSLLFLTFAMPSLDHYQSADASVRPYILKTKNTNPQKVVITAKKTIAAKNLIFKNKNYVTYHFFTVLL